LGDYIGHKIGVIGEPTLKLCSIKQNNEYLVIASSSVWNVMKPREVFEFIAQNITKGVGEVVKLLGV
jgi:serine/threonine protein phosphatase PrpC